jgi:hypothetical protein
MEVRAGICLANQGAHWYLDGKCLFSKTLSCPIGHDAREMTAASGVLVQRILCGGMFTGF